MNEIHFWGEGFPPKLNNNSGNYNDLTNTKTHH